MVKVKNFSQVTPFLYRGGLPSKENIRELKAIGVKTVIDFNKESHPHELEACRDQGLRYIHKPWTAWWHHGILFRYYHAIAEEFLKDVCDESLHPLYVHCFHGRDRTGMLIAAYRVVYEGWTIRQAVDEMKTFGFNRFFHFDLVVFLKRFERYRSRNNL